MHFEMFKSRKMKLLLFSFSTLLAASLPTYGQQKEITEQELFSMDLEQLMNVSIVSASKKSENLFDAPLSASVLTKEEIRRAGCSSLMEAFRLMPGLIVREQSSGNYDIHIRGLDNVAPNSIIPNIANTTTLVMIDNRPVYNYLQGGTFWETLPVDIADIDRIEVVRGPSSAMYGPNAVSGVINIITRKLDKVGFQGVANAQYGAFNTILANASLGYQFGPKLDIQVSGNYQSRDRQQDTYYDVEKNSWVNADQLNGSNYNSQVWFPSPSRAMDKYGVNGFVSYKPNGRTKLNLSLGSQDSRVQKVYSENGATPMSNSLSNSQYIDLKAEVSKLSAQVSFVNGTQDLTLGHGGRQYDFRTTDVTLEYNFTFKNLSLKPGLNYRQAWYDDRPYSDASKKVGIISGGYGLTTEAAFFRADYQLPGNKLRLTGGLRVDKFTHPGGLHASYQGGLTYKPSENHLLRAVYGRANRSPFIIDTYIDNFSIAELPSNDDNIRIIFQQHIEGNKNLALVNSEMIELGYRSKLSSHFQLDVEAFRTVTRDYTDLIFQKESYEDQGSTFYINYPVQIINLPLRVIQTGVTLSLNYVVSQFQVKPFVTCQDTRLADYAPYPFTPDGPAHPSNLGNPAQNNLYSGIGTQIKHQGTPSWYGGAYLNWQIGSKLNVNLNPYFYTGHTFYLSENVGYRDGERGIDAIRAKALINAKVSYQVYKGIDLFVGARNLLNNQAREFYRSDRAGASYQLGVNANF
jgi:iron complex outermembrane receptor protein